MTKEPGPSQTYRDLLRGKITSDEYVKRMKREVDERLRERLAPDKRPPPLTDGTSVGPQRLWTRVAIHLTASGAISHDLKAPTPRLNEASGRDHRFKTI